MNLRYREAISQDMQMAYTEGRQTTQMEKNAFILSGVCCDHLLYAGIDTVSKPVYKNGKPVIINCQHLHKTEKIKYKKGKDIRLFLKYAKGLKDLVDSRINKELSETETIEKAGDNFSDSVKDKQSIDLLGYCFKIMHRFGHKQVIECRKAFNRAFDPDIKQGEQLYNEIKKGFAGGLEVVEDASKH